MTNDILSTLSDMKKYASANHVPIINQEAAEFLAALVERYRPANILEIGTAIGYSSLLMASRQPQGSKLITIEKNPKRITAAKYFLKTAGIADNQTQIELIEGDAGKIAPLLEGYFDLVFIDAAKGQYLDYLHKILNKLSPHAVIVADNVLFRGFVTSDMKSCPAVPRRFRTIARRLREYLDFVQTDPRFKTEIFHYGDGLAVSYYNYQH